MNLVTFRNDVSKQISNLREWDSAFATHDHDTYQHLKVETVCSGVIQDLERCVRDANKGCRVVIALVGSMGTGKSTLLNTILGESMLPTSSTNSCTAAPCEISYEDIDDIAIEVSLLDEDIWNSELREYFEFQSLQLDSDVKSELQPHIDRIEDKIRALYQIDSEQESIGPEHCFPDESLRGVIGKPVIILHADRKKVKSTLAEYLSSKGRYWPLVVSVKIRGRFDLLRGGIVFVDLPGLNDATTARIKVTEDYLKESHRLWYVMNTKRALGKSDVDLMRGDEFRFVINNGREHALAFLGTHVDDVGDAEDAITEFQLEDDADLSEIVVAKRSKFEEVVRRQIARLVKKYGQPDFEDSIPVPIEVLDRISASPILAVSATKYAAIQKGKSVDISLEATGMQSLFSYLDESTRNHTEAGQLSRLESIRESSYSRLKLFLESNVEAMSRSLSQGVEHHLELCKFADKLEATADNRLDTVVNRNLEKIGRSINDVRSYLETQAFSHTFVTDAIARKLGSLYWATLKATCRHDGKFKSASSSAIQFGGFIDFAVILSEPISSNLVNLLRQSVERELNAKAIRLEMFSPCSDFAKDIAIACSDAKQLDENIQFQIDDLAESMVSRVSERIESIRNVLANSLEEPMRTALRNGIQVAQTLSGKGVKDNILRELTNSVVQNFQEVVTVVKPELDAQLLDCLSELANEFNNVKTELINVMSSVRDAHGLRIDNTSDYEHFDNWITVVNVWQERLDTSSDVWGRVLEDGQQPSDIDCFHSIEGSVVPLSVELSHPGDVDTLGQGNEDAANVVKVVDKARVRI
jgi:hypothetical protein